MKGIILAGGTGSRLFPLTKVTNKHLLPVGTKPMIYYPILKLVEAGISDIMIITGTEHMGAIVSLLGSGKEFGAKFTYRVQEEPLGIAHAISLCEDFAAGKPVCVILGDNIFEDSIVEFKNQFLKQKKGAMIILKEVATPERFGVATVQNGKIVKIVEKPKKPETNLAVTGIYFYDNRVFDIIKTLKPSARGEYEITDVNNAYIKLGELSYSTFKGFWTDAGTFPSYKEANRLVFEMELKE